MSTIFVDVVSAEEAIFSGKASFVALPGQEGELGILPGHVPLITRIRPGAVRIKTEEGQEEDVFVAGGTLEEAKEAREQAKSNVEIAKLEATMSALAAQLAYIRKLRH